MVSFTLNELRAKIRADLHEVRELDPASVTLSDGQETSFGSPEHVRDLQAILAGLECLKKQHRYGSAARSRFADASGQLKTMLRRAESVQSPKRVEQQKQPKTFAQLEADGPGASGLGRGEPGMGRSATSGRGSQA